MTFPQYSYRNFHNGNKKNWPLQPPTENNWAKMVHGSYIYSHKMNWWKWQELKFWLWIGRVRYCDLPSEHQYWRIQVNKDTQKKLEDLLEKYEVCKNHPEQIKFLFNDTTTIEKIEEMIRGLKEKLE